MKPIQLSNMPVFESAKKQSESLYKASKKLNRFSNLTNYDPSCSDPDKFDLLLQHAEFGLVTRPDLVTALYQCKPDQKMRIARLIRLIELSVCKSLSKLNKDIEKKLINGTSYAPFIVNIDFLNSFYYHQDHLGMCLMGDGDFEVHKIDLCMLSPMIQRHFYTVANKLSTFSVFDLYSDQADYFYNMVNEIFEPKTNMFLDCKKMKPALNYAAECDEKGLNCDIAHWFELFSDCIYFSDNIYTEHGKKKEIERYKESLINGIKSMYGDDFYNPLKEYYELQTSTAALIQKPITVNGKELEYSCDWETIYNHIPSPKNDYDKAYIKTINAFKKYFIDLKTSLDLEHDENGLGFSNSLCLYTSENKESSDCLLKATEALSQDFVNNHEIPTTYINDASTTKDYLSNFSIINAFISEMLSIEVDCYENTIN